MIKPMLLFCTAMLLGGAAAAAPSDYPTRPIRLVVNFPPAGPLDLEARAIAQHAGQLLGQTVVVENRSGASGNIGAQSVAQAAADGYTLLMTLDTLMTVNRFIFKDLERDVTARLEPVSLAGSFGMALAVRPELGVASLDEFLSYARSHPISYASAGYGSPGNLAFESCAWPSAYRPRTCLTAATPRPSTRCWATRYRPPFSPRPAFCRTSRRASCRPWPCRAGNATPTCPRCRRWRSPAWPA